jgi:predicted dehydrogenase
MIKAVVIGVGRMGRRHGKAARAAGFDLIGVADGLVSSLEVARDELSLTTAQCYHDPIEMLQSLKPDCVIVATTATSHADLTCLAAEMGARFILCEKPMATSIEDCDRMISTCARHNVRLAINHQTRFMTQYARAKEVIESKELGGFCSLHVIAGNCGLAMNGTHFFELLRFITGGEVPEEVSACFSPEILPNPRGAQFQDRAGFIRACTPSGKRLHIEAATDQGHGLTLIYSCRYGQVIVDILAGWMRVNHRKPEHRDKPTSNYGMPWEIWEESFEVADAVLATTQVLDHLIDGHGYPTGEDARTAVRTLVAAYASAEKNGIPVRLDQAECYERRFPWA